MEIINNDKRAQNGEKKGGLRPRQDIKICQDPSHNPPTHLYIPPDMEYEHICPSCGFRLVLRSFVSYCSS